MATTEKMLEEYSITRENLGDKYDQFVATLNILKNAGVENETIASVLEAAKEGSAAAFEALTEALDGVTLPTGEDVRSMAQSITTGVQAAIDDPEEALAGMMEAFNNQDASVKAAAGAGILALILGLFNGGGVQQSLTWGAVAAGVVGAGMWYMNKDETPETGPAI